MEAEGYLELYRVRCSVKMKNNNLLAKAGRWGVKKNDTPCILDEGNLPIHGVAVLSKIKMRGAAEVQKACVLLIRVG